ncbi:MAG: DUF3313 domain-containing protein [Colwellia sp.]|nr:DUF3313 domain-containing protein [Colwellia sp.]
MNKLLFTLLALVLISGCSNRLQRPDYKSDFLKDYLLFKPNPQVENSWIRPRPAYRKHQFSQYTKIALDPVEIWLNPNEAVNIVDKDKQKQLTDYFEQQIKKQVGDRFEFVEPGTADSLLIRMALTNIKELEPELSPLDLIPFRLVMAAGKEVYLLVSAQKAVIGAATLEVEFVDTNSGRGLVAVIVSNDSGEVNVSDDDTNIDSVKLVIDQWVERLALALAKTS